MSQALLGDKIELGSVTPRRDLTYVDDTVRGFLAVGSADLMPDETFVLGTGKDISVAELVSEVGGVVGRDLQVEHRAARMRPAGSEVDRLVAGPARLEQVTGWSPQVSLADGLRMTVEWVRAHSGRYRTDEYAI